jgi:uncharacterized membrane protein YgaE (UPF0421/DUF939 family)
MNIDIIDHNCNHETGLWLDERAIFSSFNWHCLGGILAFGILYLVNDKSIIGVFYCLHAIGILFYASQLQNKCHICHHVCCIHLWNHYTNISDLVQYRILDTVVGAVLAFVANHFYGLPGNF